MRRLRAGLIPSRLRRSQKTFEVWPLALSPGITIPPAAQAILAYELVQFGFLHTGEFFTRLASLAFHVRKSTSACRSAQALLPVILDCHAVLLTREL